MNKNVELFNRICIAIKNECNIGLKVIEGIRFVDYVKYNLQIYDDNGHDITEFFTVFVENIDEYLRIFLFGYSRINEIPGKYSFFDYCHDYITQHDGRSRIIDYNERFNRLIKSDICGRLYLLGKKQIYTAEELELELDLIGL